MMMMMIVMIDDDGDDGDNDDHDHDHDDDHDTHGDDYPMGRDEIVDQEHKETNYAPLKFHLFSLAALASNSLTRRGWFSISFALESAKQPDRRAYISAPANSCVNVCARVVFLSSVDFVALPQLFSNMFWGNMASNMSQKLANKTKNNQKDML